MLRASETSSIWYNFNVLAFENQKAAVLYPTRNLVRYYLLSTEVFRCPFQESNFSKAEMFVNNV